MENCDGHFARVCIESLPLVAKVVSMLIDAVMGVPSVLPLDDSSFIDDSKGVLPLGETCWPSFELGQVSSGQYWVFGMLSFSLVLLITYW